MITIQWYWASTDAIFLLVEGMTECSTEIKLSDETLAEWCFDQEEQVSMLGAQTLFNQSLSLYKAFLYIPSSSVSSTKFNEKVG